MESLTIHKVNITDGAVFDYEYTLIKKQYMTCRNCGRCGNDWNNDCPQEEKVIVMPKAEYGRELADYIQRNARVQHKHYFRVTYFDERLDIMLMLFVIKGKRLRLLQTWDIVGIMQADLWNEDDEEDGVYRSWYNTPVHGQCDYDWVLVRNLKKEKDELEEKLDDIYDKEWKQERRCEHDRRFDKKRVKESQAKLVQIVNERERLESELRLIRIRLKGYASASGVY